MAVPYTFLKKRITILLMHLAQTEVKHITEIKRKKVIKIKNTVIS